MERYNVFNNDDYLLKANLLGITDYTKLEEAEAFVFSIRAMQIEQGSYIISSFTLNDFKHLHFYLFQDIYIFAGKFRDVQLMKGDTRFCQYEFLESCAQVLFNELLQEQDWKTLEEAAQRLAYFKAELNMLHPFREGNGRTLRIFLQKYALTKGIKWDYSKINRQQYMEAMIRSKYNLDLLSKLFLETIKPLPS